MTEDNTLNNLLSLLLPSDIFEYFDIISIDKREKEVHIHLDEKLLKPEGSNIKIILVITGNGNRKNMQISGYCFLRIWVNI